MRQRANLRVPHNDSRTRVPAEKRIVIAGRAECLGPLEIFHCFPQCMIGGCGAAWPPLVGVAKWCPDDPSVIGALVVTLDLGEDLPSRCRSHFAPKLIRSSE